MCAASPLTAVTNSIVSHNALKRPTGCVLKTGRAFLSVIHKLSASSPGRNVTGTVSFEIEAKPRKYLSTVTALGVTARCVRVKRTYGEYIERGARQSLHARIVIGCNSRYRIGCQEIYIYLRNPCRNLSMLKHLIQFRLRIYYSCKMGRNYVTFEIFNTSNQRIYLRI